jgi:ubiquitin-protein ligase
VYTILGYAGWFATKIFHPNVAPSTGEICVSTLKKDWKKEYGVGHIVRHNHLLYLMNFS